MQRKGAARPARDHLRPYTGAKRSVTTDTGIAADGTDVTSRRDDTVAAIEREMTVLIRRAEAVVARQPAAERLVRSGYLLLAELESSGPLGIAALAEATRVDISTTSRQIVPLEQQGLVERLSNPADGRGSLIEITPLGLQRLRATREERYATFLRLLDNWPEEDRVCFAGYLARFNEAIDR